MKITFEGETYDEVRQQLFAVAIEMGIEPSGEGTAPGAGAPAPKPRGRKPSVATQTANAAAGNVGVTTVAAPTPAGGAPAAGTASKLTLTDLQAAITPVFKARAPHKDAFQYCQNILIQAGGWQSSESVPASEYARVIQLFRDEHAKLAGGAAAPTPPEQQFV